MATIKEKRKEKRKSKVAKSPVDKIALLTQLFERANAQQEAGQLKEAEATCRELLSIDDTHAGAWHLLGIVDLRSGGSNAIAHLERAVALKPDRADCRHSLAFALNVAKRVEEAEAEYRRAIALDPNFAEAHYYLGNLLRELGRFAEAELSYRQFLALRPNHAQAHNNLGVVTAKLVRFEEAAASFRRAIDLRPNYPEAHANLGHALRVIGSANDAEAACRRALELNSKLATAHITRGLALQDLGRLDEALACFRQADESEPGNATAMACDGMLHLLRGDFPGGWEKYEARWHIEDRSPRHFDEPQWRGEDIAGKRILLHAEQGFGDTIQFLRYVPLILARGAHVILDVPKALVPLAARLKDIEIVTTGDPLPVFDCHCPLLSLPLAFGTELGSIPHDIPYLSADPTVVEHWRQKIAPSPELKVGVVWAGSPIHRGDKRRSIPLSHFVPLFEIKNVRWFSLQVGPRATDLASLENVDIADLSGALTDFGETAAAVANLDLVICADTAVAHLAAALGKPVWVMLPSAPDWRWLLDREDSPWYPSMRLFRQQVVGDWDPVVRVVAAALGGRVGKMPRPALGASERAKREANLRAADEDRTAKRYVECEQALRSALAIDPGHANAWHVLGTTRQHFGATAEAIEMIRNAIALNPASSDAYNDLGIMFHRSARFDDAVAAFHRAIKLKPDDAKTYNNLGVSLSEVGQSAKAMEAFQRALKLKPDYYEAWGNLGHAFHAQMRLEEAADAYRRCLGIRHDYVEGQIRYAMLTLQLGDLPAGFTQFEWRWRLENMQRREFKEPAWQGEPLNGKTILLYAEQGYGDTIQCLRFIPEVAARGGQIVLELPPPLAHLTTSMEGGGHIVTQGQQLPPFDVQCAFMSLPRVLGTTVKNIPARIPYLQADPAAAERWARRLAGSGTLKVGLVWAGNPQHSGDRRRSIAIDRLAPLMSVPGVRFFSLQVGPRAGDLHRLPAGKIVDLSSELKDFKETAAVLANLDLLIAVDTSIAHLAGAMGRPCWLMLPFSPDWRWLTEREDSPWYPTLRLFRQHVAGDWDEVIERVGRALGALVQPNRKQVPPVDAEKLYAEAMALREAKRPADAVVLCERILESRPAHGPTLKLLGVLRGEAGDSKGAAELLARAAEVMPGDAETHYNLGTMLGALGQTAASVESYRRAIALSPNHAFALNNLGNALGQLGQYDEAEAVSRRAIELDPNSVSAVNNLGVLLADQDRLAEAATSFQRAITLKSDFAEGHFNLGKVFQSLGRDDDALACYRRATAIRPDYPDAHLAEAFLLLATERDWAEGWAKLEWRWRLPDKVLPDVKAPLWKGEPLHGRTILLHAEQGFGDSIMMLRYLPQVIARGGKIVLDVQPALRRLAQSVVGASIKVVAAGEPVPVCEVQCPLMSLPGIFKTTPKTIPATLPYVSIDPELQQAWRNRLSGTPGFKIGLVWAGSPLHKNDRRRSVAASRLLPLLDLPNFRWFSLQVGAHANDFAHLAPSKIIDLTPDLKDFAETAAAIANLDLVITVDTAVAHLAGAIGKTTWILLPAEADWRWQNSRGDCPWYPKARLFRQRSPGDWDGVVDQVRAALAKLGETEFIDSPALIAPVVAKPPMVDRRYVAARELAEAGRGAEAEAALRAILVEDSKHSQTLRRLAWIHYLRGEVPTAAKLLVASLERDPDHAEAHFNLGTVFRDLGQRKEAEASYRRGLALKPGSVEGYNNLGTLLEDMGRYDDAEASYRQAISMAPLLAHPYSNLGVLLKEAGKISEAISELRRAVALKSDLAAARSNLLYTLNYDETISYEAHFLEHKTWGASQITTAANDTSRFVNSRDPNRRLRVGYVSGDFRHHSVAFFLEPLIAAHDKRNVEVTLYSNDLRSDAVTARLKAHADHYVPIREMSDELAASRIREDGIDILIDLSGHTAGNRMALFARRPAPIQVTWLGYPNTTGLPTIDYRLTDAIADPPNDADVLSTERLVRLAHGFLCYRPLDHAGPVAPLPAATAGHVTFGSFNNFAKLSPQTIALWARILNAVPGSRLFLKVLQFKDAGVRQRCIATFAAHGITSDRLDLMGPLNEPSKHLEQYSHVDIALDPLPYNGVTTTCEALWMGVPVVTLRGDRHAARVGASILTTLGLPHLVAETPDEYVAIAAKLAGATGELAELRAGLRERMRQSPLCNAGGFAKEVELAYRTMWQNWCKTSASQKTAAAPKANFKDPAELEAATAKAHSLYDTGRLEDAEAAFRDILDRAPGYALAWFFLGRLRDTKGDRDAAIDFLRKAIEIDPKLVRAHNDLGIFMQNRGRLDEAEACYRRALEIDGQFAEAMSNLGAVLAERGRLEDASTWYRRAISEQGDFAPAHNNLGAALVKLDKAEEATAYHRRAIALKPDFAEAHYNLGVALQEQASFDAAQVSYDKAVELSPDYVDARWNRAFLMLLRGDYSLGWREHEWRWRRKEQPPKSYPLPLWRGEPLAGKTILLHAEQGIGDTLQFLRYVPLVANLRGRVLVAVQPSLQRLVARTLSGIAEVFSQDDVLPQFDLHCPLLSLPLAFNTVLESIPSKETYLAVDSGRNARWREFFKQYSGLKVGLVWAGNPQHKNDRRRSIALSRFAPLLGLKGVQWFSLQVGERASELESLPGATIVDLSQKLTDFDETAAAVANLDLVIAVDTAVAHLAGALGKPVWIMVPYVPDWRWLLGRDESPWYPTARLFRQPAHGDWETPIYCVRRELERRLGRADTILDPQVAKLFAEAAERLEAGDIDAAERALKTLLARDPTQDRAYKTLGVLAQRRSDHASAAPLFRRALALEPNAADAHNNLGVSLLALNRRSDAIASYRRALELRPGYATAHLNLGVALMDNDDRTEAAEHLNRAIELDPKLAEGHYNLGNLSEKNGDYKTAAKHFRRAIALKPNLWDAHNNLGAVLLKAELPADALKAFQHAVALRPDYAEAHHNLGNALSELGRDDEAIASFRYAVELDPNHVQASFAEAMLLLLTGKLREGFEKYESRWRLETLPPRGFSAPLWRGENIDGRTVLLHAEQGYGDTIQCLRYVPMVAARGGRIILEVPRELLRLSVGLPGVAEIIQRGQALPPFDLQCPLFSLPRAFGTTLETIPADIPYLSANPDNVARWQRRLRGGRGPKIGLAWAGSAQHRSDEYRSLTLKQLLPLLRVKGARWFSLQVGNPAVQIRDVADGLITDLSPQLSDFAETAAVIANLDLLISVDTAVAHLAGAMGQPAWVMIRNRPDWRWLLNRENSPWYPSLRLFRQAERGEWADVVERVRVALKSRVRDGARTLL